MTFRGSIDKTKIWMSKLISCQLIEKKKRKREEKEKGSFSTKFQLEEGIIDSEAWANFPSVI